MEVKKKKGVNLTEKGSKRFIPFGDEYFSYS